MSELIAEARVLVTPDTTTFRPLLIAQVNAAAKGVVVPIAVTPVVTGAAGTSALVSAQSELATASTATTAALAQEQALLARGGVLLDNVATKESRVASETAGATAARRAASASVATQARQLGQLQKGIGATAASFTGLRGATLAASGPFILGAIAVTAFGKALSTAVNFDQQLNVLRVTSGATADEMERVRQSAIALGQDLSLPGVSAGDAAEAMTELSKAGLDVQDSIDGTRGVLQLATAAQISNADATEIAAGALNAFGLAGDQAGRVADVLANSANAAQGSISDMAIALGQSEAVARQVGLTINDTAAILTLLAKNGLQGSDAGTSLRVALLRLVNPTEKAKKILSELNLTLRDQQGNLRPEVFAEFAEATRGMTRAQQDARAAIVFGTDAIRLQAILGREGADALHQMQAATEQQGTAADLAAARNEGLAGAMANLQNQLETTGLLIGQISTGPLTVLADALAGTASQANDLVAALLRIPATIPLPSFVPGTGGDTGGESVGDKAGSLFVAGFKKAFTIQLLGPAAFAASEVLPRLFPAAEVESGAAQAAANIRSGIEDVTAATKASAADAQTQITTALNKAFGTVGDILLKATQKARSNILTAVKAGAGRQAGLDEALNAIIAGGGSPQQQIANLRQQATVLGKAIDDAGTNAAGVVLEARRRNVQKLAAVNQQIASLQEQQVSDEKSRISTADQAVLSGLSSARSAQQNRIAQAANTANAADDIKRQEQLRDLLTRQIAVIKTQVKDEATKRDAIQQLEGARTQTTGEIQRLRQANAQQSAQLAQELSQAQLAFGESVLARTGRLNPLLQAIQAAIKDAIQARNDAKKGTLAWLQAQTAINGLINQRREAREKAQDDLVQSRLTLGQSVADLTGNQSPLLKALNFAIKEATADRNAAKKGSVVWNQAQAAINDFIKQRNEALNPDTGDAGTTLVDLFKSTQEIANQAGNVARLPSSLTSAAANAPIRDLVQQRLDIQLANPGGEALAKTQMSTTERLITTLDQLIQAIGPGPGTPVGKNQGTGTGLTTAIDTAARFRYQRVANSIVEAGVWG